MKGTTMTIHVKPEKPTIKQRAFKSTELYELAVEVVKDDPKASNSKKARRRMRDPSKKSELMIGPGTFVESLNQYVASRGIVPGWSLAYIGTASSTAQRDELEHRSRRFGKQELTRPAMAE